MDFSVDLRCGRDSGSAVVVIFVVGGMGVCGEPTCVQPTARAGSVVLFRRFRALESGKPALRSDVRFSSACLLAFPRAGGHAPLRIFVLGKIFWLWYEALMLWSVASTGHAHDVDVQNFII